MKRNLLNGVIFCFLFILLAFNASLIYAKSEKLSAKESDTKTDFNAGTNVIGVADGDAREFTYVDMGTAHGVKKGDKFMVQGKYGKVMVEVVQPFQRMSAVKIVDSWLLEDGSKGNIIAKSRYPKIKVKKYEEVKIVASVPKKKTVAKKKEEPKTAVPALPGVPEAAAPAAPAVGVPDMGVPGPAAGVPEAPGAGAPEMSGMEGMVPEGIPAEPGTPGMEAMPAEPGIGADVGLPDAGMAPVVEPGVGLPGAEAGLPGADAGGTPGLPGGDMGLPGADAGGASGLPGGTDMGLPGADAGGAPGLPGGDMGLPGAAAGGAPGLPGGDMGLPGADAGGAPGLPGGTDMGLPGGASPAPGLPAGEPGLPGAGAPGLPGNAGGAPMAGDALPPLP